MYFYSTKQSAQFDQLLKRARLRRDKINLSFSIKTFFCDLMMGGGIGGGGGSGERRGGIGGGGGGCTSNFEVARAFCCSTKLRRNLKWNYSNCRCK